MPFIVVEGVDGAGKSSVVAGVAAAFSARGRDVLVLREPGSTPIGERVRALLLDPQSGHPDPMAEALLFSACRAEMVRKLIRPALEQGRFVVLDRFFFSTLAYQGGGAGADRAALMEISRAATGGLLPDVVVLLDLPPAVAAARRTRTLDRMEANDAAYHDRVRRAYLDLAASAEFGGIFRVVNAAKPAEVVLADSLQAIETAVIGDARA